MVLTAVAAAPVVMGVAIRIERRLGPSAGGWFAALPCGFGIAVGAVLLASGGPAAGAMALSAAAHVVAQVGFAVVLAAALTRWGWLAGLVGGVGAYVVVALGVTVVPEALAVALAVPALIAAPRLIPAPPLRPAGERHWSSTALSCLACAVVVGASVLAAQWAGPVVAGAVGAFPTTSTMLAVASSRRVGRPGAVSVLVGLVRSLPSYLAFCLVVALFAPSVGLLGVPVALVVCLGVAALTWRTVPLAPRPAVPDRSS